MGSLDDPILKGFHQSIQESLYWSSSPNFQKICEILNGLSMDDMLDELWRISLTGMLDSLESYVPRAANVNVPRLRAAIGAVQCRAPWDFDALLRLLPVDQQRSIKNVRVVTQTPKPLSPTLWSKYYWSVRCLPAPAPKTWPNGTKFEDKDGASDKKADDDEAHLAADIAAGLTANAPPGTNPATYTATVIFRNLDAFKLVSGNTEIALLHEPNTGVQISPDPNNRAAAQAAVTLFNLHIKRNWGLLKPDLEFGLGAQGSVTYPGGTPGGGVQAQIELHVTSTISLTATSAVNFGPGAKPGDPPDYGSYHTGNKNVDVSFTPFVIGILGHWDPP